MNPLLIALKGKGLKAAKGENPNAFYWVEKIINPLIHAENEIEPLALRTVYEYDIETEKGDVIKLQQK